MTCTFRKLSQYVRRQTENLLPVTSILKPIFTTQTYHLHLPTCFLHTASYAHELPHALGAAAKRDVMDCICNIIVREGERKKRRKQITLHSTELKVQETKPAESL